MTGGGQGGGIADERARYVAAALLAAAVAARDLIANQHVGPGNPNDPVRWRDPAAYEVWRTLRDKIGAAESHGLKNTNLLFESCLSCHHYRQIVSDRADVAPVASDTQESVGVCTRHDPTRLPTGAADIPARSAFKRVHCEQWCGDFELMRSRKLRP